MTTALPSRTTASASRRGCLGGLAALCLLASACGGAEVAAVGSLEVDAARPLRTSPASPSLSVTAGGAATTAASPATCVLPDLPSKPATAQDVRKFGATPDDGLDDTAAIQTALDSLRPGQWLVFPPGTYQHQRRLVVRVPDVVLWSEGATLRATDPNDQAVMLAADGASIYNFTLHAATVSRLHAPWQSRIAVFDRVDRTAPLRGNVIRGNRVVEGGARGTALANSASSAGIFVYRADGFLVADNEVSRSLADGIHVTGGARNGRVVRNTVRETGDDMIAMVSYLRDGDWRQESAASLAASFEAERDLRLVRNVLVANNEVQGQYWGRGISVVGGADITIRDNRIARTTLAAGILLAREAVYSTWGVSNVLVQRNAISQVQTTTPAYVPQGWPASVARTGHAGIEIHAFVFDDERLQATLLPALSVQDLRVEDNTVAQTAANGVRIGEGTGVTETLQGTRADGTSLSRRFSGGTVGRIALSRIAMSATGQQPLAIKPRPSAANNVACDALSAEGAPLNDGACSGPPPAVTGASIGCET